jgi:hypothetical protein
MDKIRAAILLLIFCLISGALGAKDIESKGLTVKSGDSAEGKRWAIVVGVNSYTDRSIRSLSKSRNDAKEMGRIFSEKGEFEKVFVMTDNLSAQDNLYPSKVNIEAKLETILHHLNPEDTILFFFSGHGTSDKAGNGYLLTPDTNSEKIPTTAVSVNYITQQFHKKGIQKTLLILDACRDVVTTSKGAGSDMFNSERFNNAEVAATFFSTKSGFFSYEDPDSEFGVFTKYLSKGMQGDADKDNDNVISFTELEEYVQNGVTDWSLQNNKQQKPYTKYNKEKYRDIPITVRGKKFPKLPTIHPALKSAILPGWGQYSEGHKGKAALFFVGFVGFAGALVSYENKYKSTQSNYHNSSNLTLLYPSDMASLGYFSTNKMYSDQSTYARNATIAGSLLVGVYLWNMVDILFFGETKKTAFDKREGFEINHTVAKGYEGVDKTTSVGYTWRF